MILCAVIAVNFFAHAGMRSLFRFAAILILFLGAKVSASPPPGYYLVWSDEFNGTSLDPGKWWVWNSLDRSGYTVPEAATVGGGYLTLHTYSTNGTNFSPIISSDARFRVRYGYLEASVEFNGSPGMFSDFWLQSPDNTGAIVGDVAATGSELDICEHRATDANNADDVSGQVTVDLHWDGYTSGTEKSASSGLIGSGLGAGFHTYGLLWNSTNYAVSFDGAPAWSTNVGVSQRSEIILFSSEVDSNSFCGIVPPGGYGNFLVSTTSTVVDFVRFYAPTSTLYWVGASSANWSDSGNWLSNMTPASTSDIVFSYLTVGNTSLTFTQNTTVNSLSIGESPPVNLYGNTLTVGTGGIDLLSTVNDAGIYCPLFLGAGQSWNVASGHTLVVGANVSGSGSLTLNGPGVVSLEGTNYSSGPTTISNGTLVVYSSMTNAVTVAGGTLGGPGTIAAPVFLNAGVINGTEIITGPVTVNGGSLSGTGTILGPVMVNAGGAIAPGAPIGSLTISNTLTLRPGSFTTVNVNHTTGAASQIAGLTSISYGGTLIISNQSGALAAGDSFTVFPAGNYSGSFSRISPTTPGAGLVWNTNTLATDGIIRVFATTNGPLTVQLTNNQLAVSWPTINTGWLLQTQTNAPGVGLTTNWITIPGSVVTNAMTFSVDPAAGSVFYRLASPVYSTAVFAKGDLIVLRVGNGSINANGAPGFLYDFSTYGGASPVKVNLPTTGSNALTFGSSSFEGVLSLSADGRKIMVAGYNISLGSSSSALDSSSTTGATSVPRAVGSMDESGNFILEATTAKFSGSTIRSAASDGSGNVWAGGGASGIVYLGSNSPAATLWSVSTSTRALAFANGNLCFTETGMGQGVMAFTGAPKTAATPSLIINTAGTGTGTASPEGFVFNPTSTIAYVVDNRTAATGGGLQRFNWNGSAWVYAYTLGNTLTSSQVIYQMAADFSGANPVLYATTGESTANHLITVTDTGPSSTLANLETAPSGDAFRGVVFAP